MSHSSPDTHSPPQRPALWGAAIGLLAMSLATVVGVIAGLEPETILLRATIGGGVAAAVTAITAIVVQSSASAGDDGD